MLTSTLNRKSNRSQENVLKDIANSTQNAFTSTHEIKTSVGIMQDVLLQILHQQTELGQQTSIFHHRVQRQIDEVLQAQRKTRSSLAPRNNIVEEGVSWHGGGDMVKLKIFSKRTSWGTFEAACGPLAYFETARFIRPKGFALRATYAPPTWFFQIAFNLSFGLGIYPRLYIHFSIAVAMVVPYESAIFTSAFEGDIQRARDLFTSGKAAPTDRSPQGFTALHVSRRLDFIQLENSCGLTYICVS